MISETLKNNLPVPALETGKDKKQREKTGASPEKLHNRLIKRFKSFLATGVLLTASGITLERLGQVVLNELVKPKDYIEYTENLGPLESSQKETLTKQLEYIDKEFSEPVIYYLKKGHESARESKESCPSNPKIEGFEQIGLNNEKINDLWNERHYPKGTINGNISRIRFVRATIIDKLPWHGVSENTAAFVKDFSDEITFWGASEMNERREEGTRIFSDFYFAHELGHINDWVNNNNLTPSERAEFLFEITTSFNRPSSFRDGLGYIESQSTKYKKIVEYWAEVSRIYFYPDSFSKEPTKQYQNELLLAQKWLTRHDRSFMNVKSRDERIKERIKIGMISEKYK